MKHSVLWMTTDAYGLPHQEAFTQYNPDVTQHVCCGVKQKGIDGWRNCDRMMRDWLKKNLHLIDTPYLVVMEWDVLFREELDKVFTRGLEIGGVVKEPGDEWMWFNECNLPSEYKSYACGIAPMCLMCFPVGALRLITHSSFDKLFKLDLFCELRLGTMLRYMGIKIKSITYPTWITSHEIPAPRSNNKRVGIWHAVKK